MEPASLAEQCFNSTNLSIVNVAVFESEVHIDDSSVMEILEDICIPTIPHFSSIMITDKDGGKHWKTVDVNIKDHVKIFPSTGMKSEFYDQLFDDYLSNVAKEQLPESQPLWRVHIFNYPTSNAAASVILKIHQSIGDGYSMMTALFEGFHRADSPSLPLTLPSVQIRSVKNGDQVNLYEAVSDFWWSFKKSQVNMDDKTPIRSGEAGVEFRPINASIMTFSLEHIKQIGVNLGATVNDVITATIFLGTRLYMQGMDKRSSDSDSTALVALNTRSFRSYRSIKDIVKPNAESLSWGNHITLLHVPIPKLTDIGQSAHPFDIVKNVQEIIKKKRVYVPLTDGLQGTVKEYAGPEAAARYIHGIFANTSMAMSNLIGPGEKIAFANHPIKSMYFFSTGCPQNLVVTSLSYMENLKVVLATEKGFINAQKLKSCIESAFEVLLKATSKIPAKI